MPFCEKCGSGLTNDVKFCQSCGAPVNNPVQPVQQMQQPVYPAQQTPISNIPNYNPMARTEREPHVQFMFVTALVFMIFYIIRAISAVASIEGYAEIADIVPEISLTAYIGIGLTVFACIAILTFFVLVTMAKNRNRPIANRINLSKNLLIFSIIALICGIGCMAGEITLIVVVSNKVKGTFWQEQTSLAIGACVFHALYLTFASINIWRAHAFRENLKKLPPQE